MQLNLPLHKGHILVKRGNSSMNDIYTKLVFLYKSMYFFCKSRVSVLPFEIIIENVHLKIPFMLS